VKDILLGHRPRPRARTRTRSVGQRDLPNIDKIRDHYFGPIYGDYKFKAQLDRNEEIRFECFDSWSENRVSFDCTISRGDYWMPPDTNCTGKK